LASHGYIVFALDHHDGSNPYTEDSNGKPVVFDTKAPHYEYEDMHKKVIKREGEVK
jgi:hypothetical protein